MQIANGNGITESDGIASYYRVPGYSLFLSGCYKFFDFDVEKTILVQILLSALIPILIFLLSMTLFPGHILVAKISSFLFVFNLGNWLYSGLLMTEIIFMILFLIFMILFLSCFRFVIFGLTGDPVISKKSYYKVLIISGLFLGLAFLVRPVGVFVVFLSLFILFVSKLSMQQKFKFGILFFLSWFLVVSFWLVRNFLLTGCVFFHTLPGKHFLYHSASFIVMQEKNTSYLQAKKKLVKELDRKISKEIRRKGSGLNVVQECIIAERLAFRYILASPFLFLKYSLANILKTVFRPFSEEFLFIQEKN